MHNYECASFMKAALVFADRLSTVSPTYAQEIRDPAFAYRQEGILNARAGDTWGILNGMNQEEFNPETDPLIPYHFNKDDLSDQGSWIIDHTRSSDHRYGYKINRAERSGSCEIHVG